MHSHKKSPEWYAAIIQCHRQGLSVNRITQIVGGQYKSVWAFLKKWRMENAESP